MSRERQLQLDAAPLPSPADAKFQNRGSDDIQMSNGVSDHPESSSSLLSYIHAQDPEWNASARSIFEAGTPGAPTLAEVERDVDLGRWKLKLRGYPRLVPLEVS